MLQLYYEVKTLRPSGQQNQKKGRIRDDYH
nr:MAG TPA: hypothetical protein [Caudoviricetes sp.]